MTKSNISDETDFARSMGLVHEFLSKTDLDQLFVMEPLTPLSVHSILLEDKQMSRHPTCPKYGLLI